MSGHKSMPSWITSLLLKQRSFDKFSPFLIYFNHFNVQVPPMNFSYQLKIKFKMYNMIWNHDFKSWQFISHATSVMLITITAETGSSQTFCNLFHLKLHSIGNWHPQSQLVSREQFYLLLESVILPCCY